MGEAGKLRESTSVRLEEVRSFSWGKQTGELIGSGEVGLKEVRGFSWREADR